MRHRFWRAPTGITVGWFHLKLGDRGSRHCSCRSVRSPPWKTNGAARTFLAPMHLAVEAVLVPGLRGTAPARESADAKGRQS